MRRPAFPRRCPCASSKKEQGPLRGKINRRRESPFPRARQGNNAPRGARSRHGRHPETDPRPQSARVCFGVSAGESGGRGEGKEGPARHGKIPSFGNEERRESAREGEARRGQWNGAGDGRGVQPPRRGREGEGGRRGWSSLERERERERGEGRVRWVW